MSNLGDLYKAISGEKPPLFDAVEGIGDAIGTLADIGGVISLVLMVVSLFDSQDDSQAAALQQVEDEINQLLGELASQAAAEDKLRKMQDVDNAITPAKTVLGTLTNDLKNLPGRDYILQQVDTCITAVNFFDYDEKWWAVSTGGVFYTDRWSRLAPTASFAPPTVAPGFVFNYTYTLPQYVRAIAILLLSIQVLDPTLISRAQSALSNAANRLKSVHDTIQDGILGSKLPAPRDMGYETGFGGPPTYYVTWYNYVNDDSSEGLSLYPYGAIDQYSGVNNVGSYLLYLVEPTVFQNPATTVSSNVIKLISLRIRAQQKKLYAALGLPSIVALINLINSQLGQTSQLGTPFMEWTVDEAFSILCLPVSGADETNQEKLAAFLLQTPEFRSYEVAPNRNMGQAATKQARPIPYGTTKLIQN